MKEYYIVYVTTNNLNGKIYVGSHATNNLDDGYLGSGKVLKQAIKKYGRESFSREVIATFAKANDLGVNLIKNWCRDSDKLVAPNYQVPEKYWGRTRRENGFYRQRHGEV